MPSQPLNIYSKNKMCTVTYLPLTGKGFLLTSTRDEKIVRQAAIPPMQYEVEKSSLYYPRDPDAQGTWIASSVAEYSLCLLNGGFVPHQSNPPYRMSRGHVILDFFKYNNPGLFRDKYNFEGLEPFTLLIIGYESRSLDEIRWDGKQVYHEELNAEIPAIWSSVTLYSKEIISKRQDWFNEWLLTDPDFCIENAVYFHKNAGTGNPDNDILMNRDNVRTVSITSVFRSNSLLYEMYYEDTIEEKVSILNNLGNKTFLIL